MPDSLLCASQLRAGSYLALNVVSGVLIIFANKLVFSVYGFHFVYALTFIHAVTTAVGSLLFAYFGLFVAKHLPARSIAPLAVAFVGYVVFWNLSLQVNTVGFYQLSKICVTPTVMAIECVRLGRKPLLQEVAAVVLLSLGVCLAVVSDVQISANPIGLIISGVAIAFTAVFQTWAGSKQKELEANSMQLMHQYAPYAAGLLLVCVVLFEPSGLDQPVPDPDTLLGFSYTFPVCFAIAITAILGVLVSLSTFLAIGSTSSVMFNVIGHTKLIIILLGGYFIFGEEMPPKRLAGVIAALAGVFWYSYLRLHAPKPVAEAADPKQSAAQEPLLPDLRGTGQAAPAENLKAAI